jgi:pimeloyl-ACP methyl ester carboxylesterase
MLLLDKYERVVRQGLRLLGVESRYRVISGQRVHYYELQGEGSGPPLVLVHGLGASANSFAAIVRGLKKRWGRIYLPDLPGHGFTPDDPGQGPLDLRQQGQLLYAFLQLVVRDRAVLVGHSMGGALTLGVTVEKPAEVLAVGLLSPAGAPLSDGDLASLRRRFAPQSRQDAIAFVRNLTHRPLIGASLAASDLGERLRSRALQHILMQTTSSDRLNEEILRQLKIPMLLVWGASERLLPAGGLDYFRAHLPSHTRIEVLERCGHMPQMEQPQRTLELLNELAALV